MRIWLPFFGPLLSQFRARLDHVTLFLMVWLIYVTLTINQSKLVYSKISKAGTEILSSPKFRFCNISNFWRLRRVQEQEGYRCNYKSATGGILWWYFDCINVNILVVILSYSFARCYYRGNWVKGTWVSLYYFLQLYMNL